MKAPQYSAPVSRVITFALGVIVTLMGAPLVAFFGFGLYRLRSGVPSSDAIVALCILGILGFGLCVVGLRLLTGKRRRDGGLFSPWFLRLGGVFFCSAP